MSHLPECVALAIAVHGLALAIVNLTPTPKDNEALGSISAVAVKVYRVIELLAGIGPMAKR